MFFQPHQIFGFPARLALPKGQQGQGFPVQLLVVISQSGQQSLPYGPVIPEQYQTYQQNEYQVVDNEEYFQQIQHQGNNGFGLKQSVEVVPEIGQQVNQGTLSMPQKRNCSLLSSVKRMNHFFFAVVRDHYANFYTQQRGQYPYTHTQHQVGQGQVQGQNVYGVQSQWLYGQQGQLRQLGQQFQNIHGQQGQSKQRGQQVQNVQGQQGQQGYLGQLGQQVQNTQGQQGQQAQNTQGQQQWNQLQDIDQGQQYQNTVGVVGAQHVLTAGVQDTQQSTQSIQGVQGFQTLQGLQGVQNVQGTQGNVVGGIQSGIQDRYQTTYQGQSQQQQGFAVGYTGSGQYHAGGFQNIFSQGQKIQDSYASNYYQNKPISQIIGGAISLDGRPLGYPLDRPLSTGALSVPNVHVQTVYIYHEGQPTNEIYYQ